MAAQPVASQPPEKTTPSAASPPEQRGSPALSQADKQDSLDSFDDLTEIVYPAPEVSPSI